jgi:hypothetical protein
MLEETAWNARTKGVARFILAREEIYIYVVLELKVYRKARNPLCADKWNDVKSLKPSVSGQRCKMHIIT